MGKGLIQYRFIRLFLPSLLNAVLYACVGWLFFLLIEQVGGAFINGEKFDHLDIQFVSFAFISGSLIFLLPVAISTCLLGIWLYHDFLTKKLAEHPSIFKGVLIGGITGFGISLFVWIFIILISNREPDFWLFAFRIIMVTLISLFIGGWMGEKWFTHLLKLVG